jgi:hypothetical protein
VRYALSPYVKHIRFIFKGLIQTLLNQTLFNPDRVPGKINFYFGADNSRINHRHKSEVTGGF